MVRSRWAVALVGVGNLGRALASYRNFADHGYNFVAAFDKRTGDEIWRRPRSESTSWSTPAIFEVDGRPQVIICATNASRAYDLATGDEIWSLGGMTRNCIPTPIHRDGVVYLMSGFRGNMLQAVRLAGAKGDVTGTDQVLWTRRRRTPYWRATRPRCR